MVLWKSGKKGEVKKLQIDEKEFIPVFLSIIFDIFGDIYLVVYNYLFIK
jgi:hypothetical protein